MNVTFKAFSKAVFCLLFATGLFCLGAAYNRFPVLYPDSVAYLFSATFFEFGGERPVAYSLWLAAGHAVFRSYWFGVVGQSFITALLIRWVMRAHGISRLDSLYLLACGILAVVTGIWWQTGRLMADAFTAPMVLSFYLLAFFPGKIGRARRVAAIVIFVFSLLVHYSHLPIALAAFFLLWAWLRMRGKAISAPMILLGSMLAVVPFSLALNVSLGLNYYSKNQYAYLLSRLVENGSVARFLEENCEQKEYLFCRDRAYVTNQSVGGFLWGKQGPFVAKESQAQEYRELIRGIFWSDPWGQLGSGLEQFGLQLVRFGSGDSLEAFSSGWEMRNIQRASPKEFLRFERSRQQGGDLQGVVFKLNKIYYLFFWISALFMLGFLFASREGWSQERELVLTAAIFLAINAFVCGVFSGAYDRYQSRVAWLPVFAALLILARWCDRRLRLNFSSRS